MTSRTDAASAEHWMKEAFGSGFDDYQTGLSSNDFGIHLNDATRLFELSGVAAHLAQWRLKDQKAASGRPAIISPAAALIVMMAHMQARQGLLFTRMARTLDTMTPAELTMVGIHKHAGTYTDWYDRLWRAVQALMALVDPLPGNRHRVPSVAEYKAILAARDITDTERKQKRLDLLCVQLLEASVKMLPREILRRYKGNIAHDATFIALTGKAGNPQAGKKESHRPRRSINYDGGYYVRDGAHDGNDKALKGVRKHGLEIEISMMVPNHPGAPATFPLFAVGVSCHVPGAIRGEGTKVVESIAERGYPKGLLFVDRAYPNGIAREFQGPMARLGYDLCFDYKKTDLGITDYFRDAIQVGGQWYLNLMPDDLINAASQHLSTMDSLTRRSAESAEERTQRKTKETAAEALLATRLASRDNYRFTRKGRRDADGFQRYSYPDPAGYVPVDKITGEILAPIGTKSLTIPLERGLKHGQHFPHGSTDWKANYGMRSNIEGFNSYVKDPDYEDLETAGRRRARGNTFAYLASTMALISANLRKMYRFLQNAASVKPLTAKTRARRRTVSPEYAGPSPVAAQKQPPPE